MEFRVVRATAKQRSAVSWAALFRCTQQLARAHASTSVALLLVPPSHMARLNATYRGKHGPTDVLAFPEDHQQQKGVGSGDVVLCPAVLRQRFPGTPQAPLLAHRFVHALLHLHGYQHNTVAADRRMEALIQRCLRTFYGPHYLAQHQK